MYENGWGLNVNNIEARKWFAVARAAGSGDADRHIRQLKAEAASHDPDPPPESRPKLPEKINPPAVTPPVVEQSPNRTAVEATALPALKEPVSTQAPRRIAQTRVEESEASGTTTLSATVTRRSPLTPIILIVFGVIMGLTVFKWMRRGAYKRSVF
jgi:hypothetical protein